MDEPTGRNQAYPNNKSVNTDNNGDNDDSLYETNQLFKNRRRNAINQNSSVTLNSDELPTISST